MNGKFFSTIAVVGTLIGSPLSAIAQSPTIPKASDNDPSGYNLLDGIQIPKAYSGFSNTLWTGKTLWMAFSGGSSSDPSDEGRLRAERMAVGRTAGLLSAMLVTYALSPERFVAVPNGFKPKPGTLPRMDFTIVVPDGYMDCPPAIWRADLKQWHVSCYAAVPRAKYTTDYIRKNVTVPDDGSPRSVS